MNRKVVYNVSRFFSMLVKKICDLFITLYTCTRTMHMNFEYTTEVKNF